MGTISGHGQAKILKRQHWGKKLTGALLFFHNTHTRKGVSTRVASHPGSSLFLTLGTRLIYRPRVLGSVLSGGGGEGAGERLSYFPKGQLAIILEDLIHTLLSYPRWSFGVFLWELFTLGKLASSSSSFFVVVIPFTSMMLDQFLKS